LLPSVLGMVSLGRMTVVSAVWTLVVLFAGATAHGLAHNRSEIRIPMSDTHPGTGETVSLAADLYLPMAGGGPWPVILVQTPYGKGNSYLQWLTVRATDPLLNSSNYALVVMDWRGFGTSGSEEMDYAGSPPTERDGYEAVEWIARQSWCVGKVGTWGASALGNIQLRTAALRPPSLVCAVPIVYHWREWYDQCYPGGIYARNRNDFVYGMFGGLGLIRSIPLETSVWEAIEGGSGDPAQITIPILHITGWYDHETLQTVREMQAIQRFGGVGAAGQQKLLIGPWCHGAVGMRRQNEMEYPVAEYEDSLEALAFFDWYLRGVDNGWIHRPAVRFFRMNEDVWVEAEDWPPTLAGEKRWYLQANGSLSRRLPSVPGDSFGWVSDPGYPVPSICGALVHPSGGQVQGPGDLISLEGRDDVLAFSTPPLREPLSLAGQGRMVLWVRSLAVDTDLHLRLTQVWPDGRSMWLGDGARRVSMRNGYASREWLEPEAIYEVVIELPPLAVQIPPGHRLRVLVTSANHDRFDVILQDGSHLSDQAGAQAVVAKVSLYVDPAHPSCLVWPCVGEFADTDGDGLPDWWEELYFGGATLAMATGDEDRDGQDNAEEYGAGTDPGDPVSELRVTGLRFGEGAHGGDPGYWIEWNSVGERDYAVWQSEDMVNWSLLVDGLVGDPPINRHFVVQARVVGGCYYRVAVSGSCMGP